MGKFGMKGRSVVATAALTAGMLVLSGSVASAADGPYVDQNHPVSGFTGNWKPAGIWDIAQPFEPASSGIAVDFTVAINAGTRAGAENHFAAAEIRRFPAGETIDDEPIVGGVGVLSFPDESLPSGHYPAVVSFPQEPQLEEGLRYALVIDPATTDGGSASFPMSLDGVSSPFANLFVQTKESGSWEGYATGRLFFKLRMAPTPEEPVAPEEPEAPVTPEDPAESEAPVDVDDDVGDTVAPVDPQDPVIPKTPKGGEPAAPIVGSPSFTG